MIINGISIFVIILLMATSFLIFITKSWRWRIIFLAAQYLAAFWLVSLLWSLGLAVVKLVVGWMVCAVLGASQNEQDSEPINLTSAGTLFKMIVTVFVWFVVYSIAPKVAEFIPTGMVVLWGGLLLAAMSLIQLGMTTEVKASIIGLLTLMSGFEILYAAVENSILVTGLLAMINLSLALAGSYLIASRQMGGSSS